jgi:polyisoprenoid-binding protein YceI
VIVLSFCAVPGFGQEVVLHLDPGTTKVGFTLGGTVHTVHGNFKLKSGTIQFDPASGKAGGQVVVDATSGESGSDGRDRRMHQKILESERYPEIVFTPDRVEGKVTAPGTSEVQIHGLFQIHGVAHEITLPVQVKMGAGEMSASMRFDVPYVKWGMKNPSTLFLRVSDKVTIEIRTVGKMAE